MRMKIPTLSEVLSPLAGVPFVQLNGKGRSQRGLPEGTGTPAALRLGSRLSHTSANPNKLICNLRGEMMVTLCLSLSTPPASLYS